MVEGTKLNLGGQEFIVPALNFKLLKQFKGEIKELRTLGDSSDPMSDLPRMIPVIAAAMQRNYPDMTETEVESLLDLSNYRDVMEAVLGVTTELRLLLKERLAKIAAGETAPLTSIMQ